MHKKALALSFVFFSILAAEPQNVSRDKQSAQSIFTQCKAACTKFLNSSFSYTCQLSFFLVPYFTITANETFNELMQNNRLAQSLPSIVLTELPLAMQTTITKMGAEKYAFKLVDYVNGLNKNAAAIQPNTIFIGAGLVYDVTDEEQTFVLGHEIVHLQKNHYVKYHIGLIFTILSTLFLPKIIRKYSNKLTSNMSKNSYLARCIKTIKQIAVLIDNNPLLQLIIIKTITTLLCQHHEREADITSAMTLNAAQGGVTYFTGLLALEKNIQNYVQQMNLEGDFFSKYIFPYPLAKVMTDFFGWTTHPPTAERIAYLKALC